MRKSVLLFLVALSITFCTKKPILRAYQYWEYDKDSTLLTLYDDEKYSFKKYDHRSEDIDSVFGEYKIKNDTILFSGKLKSEIAKSAILKNHFVEFLSSENALRLKIKESKLRMHRKIDSTKFPNFRIFTFQEGSKIFPKNAKNYDLSENDIVKITTIINKCVSEKAGQKLDYKNTFNQVVAVKNQNGEIEVFVNCYCTKSRGFDYVISNALDGYGCFVSLRLNLTTGKCVSVNFS